MDFFTRLDRLSSQKKTSLCIGLDDPDPYGRKERIFRLIENTEKHTLCYKLNPAFYGDSTGEVHLRDIAFYLNNKNLPWIYDGKRGDVPHTNEKYAQIIYDVLKAPAVTLNPLLGLKALQPFRKEGKGIFLLDRTSNEGAEEIQQHTSKIVRRWCQDNSDLGLVVAANREGELDKAWNDILNEGWILAPGVGTQGGVITPYPRTLFSVSRSILHAKNQAETAESLALQTRVNLRDILSDEGIILKGEFTLSSGAKSDTYVDMRKLCSRPEIFKIITDHAIRAKPRGHLLAVATGGIPIAASISVSTMTPFGYIREDKKSHGRENKIEGDISRVFPVVIVDDTATSGGSLIRSIQTARSSGYIITSALVLVERKGGGAREALEEMGVTLISLVEI